MATFNQIFMREMVITLFHQRILKLENDSHSNELGKVAHLRQILNHGVNRPLTVHNHLGNYPLIEMIEEKVGSWDESLIITNLEKEENYVNK